VISNKPFGVLGDFWQPILDRVREVEQGRESSSSGRVWGEANGNLVHSAQTPEAMVRYLKESVK
jgi:hypothetical protein